MFPIETLQFTWFTAFVALLAGYAILDGFDLGVGMLHMFSRDDRERRLMLNAIGPVWDGNEVWLVTAGGALFAGFPDIYATVCSGYYEGVMILLGGLIFRAVAIEFRSKQPMAWWRWMWDILFSLASLIIALVLGLMIGNFIGGMEVAENKEFIGDGFDFISPYSFLVAIFTVSLFCMHGAIYLLMKTEGEFHDKIRSYTPPLIIAFIMLYAITTVATLIYMPHMTASIQTRPVLFLFALVNFFAIANIPREIFLGRDGRAFLSSCVNILMLLVLYGIGTFPNVVRAKNAPETLSLTIFNSSSSLKTLEILHFIALIGLPLVISYTIAIYWIFRGKVRLDPTSY